MINRMVTFVYIPCFTQSSHLFELLKDFENLPKNLVTSQSLWGVPDKTPSQRPVTLRSSWQDPISKTCHFEECLIRLHHKALSLWWVPYKTPSQTTNPCHFEEFMKRPHHQSVIWQPLESQMKRFLHHYLTPLWQLWQWHSCYRAITVVTKLSK